MRTRLPFTMIPACSLLLVACAGAARDRVAASSPGLAPLAESPSAPMAAPAPGYPAATPAGAMAPADVAAESPPAVAGRSVAAGAAPLARPAPVAAAVSVAAGEWDDNANYREFQRWLATSERLPFHRIDVSQRRFIVVRDANGKPVPRCSVTIGDREQHRTVLTTAASGRAVLFPHAEGLVGGELTATASCDGSTATSAFALEGDDGTVDIKLPTARQLPSTRPIDVAFVLDTTGSMDEEIAAVKSTIQKVASSLDRGNLDLRIGLVAFKDRGDEYVTRVYPLTSDIASFERTVADIHASGGGDTPESVNEAVHVALTRLEWNAHAIGRYAFLIGDAPPHLDYAQDFDYAADARTAAHRGIQIFTIAASGMDDLGQVVWRQIAQYTNARNMFVLRGGAGPQSTGAGDPKSSCGGTQTNYTSENLDALIVADITRETRALDTDPLRIAGLNRDENAKPCSERLVAKD